MEEYSREFGHERRNPFDFHRTVINEYLSIAVRDVKDKLMGDLMVLHIPDKQQVPEFLEFVYNMAAEDQYFHEMANEPRHEDIQDCVWKEVIDTRKRNSLVSTSYRVQEGNEEAGMEIR